MTMTEPTRALSDLKTGEMVNLKTYFEANGPSDGFTQIHYDAVCQMLLRQGYVAPEPSPSGSASDLVAWARNKVQASAPHRPQPEAEVEEKEVVPPSINDRPESIDAIVGQKDLVGQLRIVCMGAKKRGTKIPHILLSGPAGYGKTTIANVVSKETGIKMIVTIGNQIKRPADLVGILLKVDGPVILFIDEIHAMSKAAQESLYTVMEDGRIDVIGGYGSDSVAYSKEIPGLVVIGATTNPGKLNVPMRDRFGFQGTYTTYSDVELGTMVSRGLEREGMSHDFGEAVVIAQRSKGTPRRALALAQRVLDYAAVIDCGNLKDGIASDALAVFGINEAGLDETDVRILEALTVGQYAGKAVGMDTLAQYLNLDAITLRDQYEPFLTRAEYLIRGKGGRQATPKAYALVKELGLGEEAAA